MNILLSIILNARNSYVNTRFYYYPPPIPLAGFNAIILIISFAIDYSPTSRFQERK